MSFLDSNFNFVFVFTKKVQSNSYLSVRIEKNLPKLLVPKSQGKKKSRPAVNRLFMKRFARLLKILIPSIVSPEFGYTVFVGAMLVLRTMCDVWMLTNGTKIERAIITRDPKKFAYYVWRYASLMLPIRLLLFVVHYCFFMNCVFLLCNNFFVCKYLLFRA